MNAPVSVSPAEARLCVVEPDGAMRHTLRSELGLQFAPGDVAVANDAATLPASLHGIHVESGAPLEIRLAAWVNLADVSRFTTIAFGPGDYRTPTERRLPPPPLKAGDRLLLGPLVAHVGRASHRSRLIEITFEGDRDWIFSGLARHGQPIQYAHVAAPPALSDVWTKLAAEPIAFEPPSAGFALDWRTLALWRGRGVEFVTLTHAAGVSSTGDALLDEELPFDEPYRIPKRVAAAIRRAKSSGARVVAIGTSVVRALESAAEGLGRVRAGEGVAKGRIGRGTALTIVDAILTGIHSPGDSHFELLSAFLDDRTLGDLAAELARRAYREHEFGDFLLAPRRRGGRAAAAPHPDPLPAYAGRGDPPLARGP